ncbi:MAG TPA: ABC transporter substrate-binding protein [Burkholderiales bacterium]|nr:ABC transporter substrate-binding protein [Burkholderiales bacterium]
MRPLKLIAFPGGFNWPVWAARETGAFERHGVTVEVIATPGSVFQWTSLAQGSADVAITLMDNVIAYREGQGAPGVAVPDAVALMGLDVRSMPTLVANPEIRTYAQLEGKALAVDSLVTGNALVLIAMLERAGLGRDDYRLEAVGGVAQRFEGLRHGQFAASLFNAPLDAQLLALGFNRLDDASIVLPRFQGHVVAARSSWARANAAQVIGFMRALIEALAWLYEPRHREQAFALFERNVKDAATGDAATSYRVLFDRDTGFPRDGAIDIEGVAAVLALRGRYGAPARALGAPSGYCDTSFLTAARAASTFQHAPQ